MVQPPTPSRSSANLVRAGVDVVRLNFSHGTHEEKLALIQMIRKVSRELKKPLCILADLQGPKIRTSKLKDHKPVLLKEGERLTITPREVPGSAALVGTTFKTLAENVEQGSRILLSDGLIELRVHEVTAKTWSARSSTAECWAKTRASICPEFRFAFPR